MFPDNKMFQITGGNYADKKLFARLFEHIWEICSAPLSFLWAINGTG